MCIYIYMIFFLPVLRITRIRGGKKPHENDKCPKKLFFCIERLKMTKTANFSEIIT